ncbi:MAG: NAD-dependent epimerase/dehydratase family protein [Phycisphaerales bacterium]|nr:NAD-dependent epimerase/dehydratase family protein [Phycisphaerales bacterium]
MKALVTGGGGFLGRAIVVQLLERGYQVSSCSRGRYPEIERLGVQVTQVELTDAEAVRAACRGKDVVFHVAAKAGVGGTYEEYARPNVRGTENIIAACRAEGVSRLVYTSSPSVVFNGRDMEGVDESVPILGRRCSPYSLTKAVAERIVLAANGPGLRTIAVRPHLIWGPRDTHIVPQIIARARAGKLRIIGRGHNLVDTTYVDNAAEAHLMAAEALGKNPAAAGKAFFIGQGEPIMLWDMINRILAAADLPPVHRRVPYPLAWMTGAVQELVYRWLKLDGEPWMTRFLANTLATAHWFDISAARRELGYEPRVSVAEGLARLAAWLREFGDKR